jgi:hypothetical protein
MKFIEGKHHFIPEDANYDIVLDKLGAHKAFGAVRIYDVHEENFVITESGKKVIIDLGE